MIKTAVVYDKWLSQLGGGEVVACTAARILKDQGYKITFITGKYVSLEDIRKKLNIDLSDIEFKTAWNDELEIKKLSKGKDVFINFTFMDYSLGHAKKNIYYTHFPTRPYNNPKGKIINSSLLLALKYGFIPQEIIKGAVQFSYHHVSYSLKQKVRLSFYYLSVGKTYKLEFKIYLPNFSKSLLQRIYWNVEKAEILGKSIELDHKNNLLKINASIIPIRRTIYFEVGKKENSLQNINDEAFLIYKPHLYYFFNISGYFNWLQQRLNRRLRAGVFRNALLRIQMYNLIIVNSKFSKKWVRNYWQRESKVIYPPVKMVYKKYSFKKIRKSNQICSVGRFFTTGHGKKQEILIEGFKKFYDAGFNDWQLHLIGGVGQDERSLKFIEKLKNQALNYPIFIHTNISRRKLIKILRSSRFYWHATGYGESRLRHPILFEHFGIAAVEAISAGCIPILYNGGGLPEIIDTLNLDRNLHLFNTLDELVKNTIYFIKGKKQIPWKIIFKRLEANFSHRVFEEKFNSLLK